MGILSSFNKLIKSHSARMIWYRVAIIISSLAIFVTTYLLMLPASTTEGATKITQLGDGIHDAITYDENNNLQINVNNIYRIDAFLGPDAASGKDTTGIIKDVLDDPRHNTVLVRLRDYQGNIQDGCGNLGEFLFSDYNGTGATSECYNFSPFAFYQFYLEGGSGTSDTIGGRDVDFSEWVAIRVECYEMSQYDTSRLNGQHSAYEFYAVQQIFGMVDRTAADGYYKNNYQTAGFKNDDFANDMGRKLHLGNTTKKGFILLVRKDYINNHQSLHTANNPSIYSDSVGPLYVPQAGYHHSKNTGAGYNAVRDAEGWYNEGTYEPGQDCIVDFNQDPLAFKLISDGRTEEVGDGDPREGMSLGIYTNNATIRNVYTNKSINYGFYNQANSTKAEKQNGLGFITFSLQQDQRDYNSSTAPDNSLEENDDIDFKLFNYSEYINLSQQGKLTNSSDKGKIREIAPFFSFRNSGLFYNYNSRNMHRPHYFWWHDYSPCNCANMVAFGSCIKASSPKETGLASYLHTPSTVTHGGGSRLYDLEGFVEYHSTVEYNLVGGYPVLDLSRSANYTPVTFTGNLNDTAHAGAYYPFNYASNAANHYGLDQTDRSLAYLFGGDSDFAVTAFDPSNSILQYEQSTGRYHYSSAINAVDYDPVNNEFVLRDYVESGDYGATESVQTFDFFPFNYSSGYVTGTHVAKGTGGSYTLRAKSFNDSACVSKNDITFPVNNGTVPEMWNQSNTVVGYDNIDYWFGMSMEFSFIQDKDGIIKRKNDNGTTTSTDMIFSFSGDDDVWVFIDDVLVLDLGGTHTIVEGSIDFTNGAIIQRRSDNHAYGYPTTLIECFGRAGKLRFDGQVEFYNADTGFDYDNFIASGKVPDGWKVVESKVRSGLKEFIFEDYSVHDLNFFYLERGGHVANNSIEFYLTTFPNNSLLVEKQVDSVDDQNVSIVKENQDYKFRVLYADANGNLLTENNKYMSVFSKNDTFKLREYDADHVEHIEVGIVGDDGIFTLKHGQTAIFEDMYEFTNKNVNKDDQTVRYYVVQEILPNGLVNQHTVKVNDGEVTGKEDDIEGHKLYTSSQVNSASTNHILYKNIVKSNSLEIIKNLDLNGYTDDIDNNSVFSVKVMAYGKPIPVGTEYLVYNLDDNNNIVGEGETVTVNDAGIVNLKHKQKVVIYGFLNGAEFEVKELFDGVEEGYIISYSATSDNINNNSIAVDNTVGEVTGTMNLIDATKTGKVTVTVNNKRNGTTIQIPVNKELKFYDKLNGVEDQTFKFNLVEVDSNYNILANGFTSEITISNNISDMTSNEFGSGMFTLSFPDDFVVGTTEKYYKITEVEDEIINSLMKYDSSSYVFYVSIQKDATGNLTTDWKLTKFVDENDKVGEVISKKSDGANASPTVNFVNVVYYDLPTTGANLFVSARSFVLVGAILILGALVTAIILIIKRRKI